ncbi:type II toxin-antitoxin system RelB/DinJ family antitoxin [Paratractidigestivibacter sp.]|uniref:type II toxin-antitoxin system RelB/DinJ family antitoxin n=1 Tax=Paratractidigestivibacter sp. TaxID=2847316 RepID=UPI002ABD386A|nr:type II toxin-antitoxin system RelB/DinJ family antitoxin [Paratractidigestivibacter sp.]
MATALVRNVEGKYRTSGETKDRAAEVYARWGLSLSDAINVFLVKSVEVGGLPFSMRPDAPSYDSLATRAYKAPLNDEGVPVLPADWDDDDD